MHLEGKKEKKKSSFHGKFSKGKKKNYLFMFCFTSTSLYLWSFPILFFFALRISSSWSTWWFWTAVGGCSVDFQPILTYFLLLYDAWYLLLNSCILKFHGIFLTYVTILYELYSVFSKLIKIDVNLRNIEWYELKALSANLICRTLVKKKSSAPLV